MKKAWAFLIAVLAVLASGGAATAEKAAGLVVYFESGG